MIGERFHSLVLWIRRFFLLNDKTVISIWEFFLKKYEMYIYIYYTTYIYTYIDVVYICFFK